MVILFNRYYRFMEKVNLGCHMFQPPQYRHTLNRPLYNSLQEKLLRSDGLFERSDDLDMDTE